MTEAKYGHGSLPPLHIFLWKGVCAHKSRLGVGKWTSKELFQDRQGARASGHNTETKALWYSLHFIRIYLLSIPSLSLLVQWNLNIKLTGLHRNNVSSIEVTLKHMMYSWKWCLFLRCFWPHIILYWIPIIWLKLSSFQPPWEFCIRWS